MAQSFVVRFAANLWLVPGKGGWHMLNLPLQLSAELKDKFSQQIVGWGRIRVKVQIADQHWQTSLFRDDSASVFMLPVKARVRRNLKLEVGSLCQVQLILPER
jgi:hypothetical protein